MYTQTNAEPYHMYRVTNFIHINQRVITSPLTDRDLYCAEERLTLRNMLIMQLGHRFTIR